jgi:hypothetical protein
VAALADRVPTLGYVAAAAVALVGVVAGLGGFNTVEETSPPQIDAGVVQEGRQLDITVNDAWLADGLGTYLKPAEGSRMLVVEVTVTNVSNKSVNTLRDNILVDGLKGADGPKSDRVLILGEGSTTPDFQPGVTQDAALVWEVPAGSYAEGDPVVVRILDKSLSPGLLFAAAWTNPEETAHVAVELGDRGDRYLEAEDRS